uniref:Uncharacterized protein n=1 Tax=Oryza punctata TaxID=4537 RepID=A0A0E0JK28_ORYPU
MPLDDSVLGIVAVEDRSLIVWSMVDVIPDHGVANWEKCRDDGQDVEMHMRSCTLTHQHKCVNMHQA